jgi:hypothetical protein
MSEPRRSDKIRAFTKSTTIIERARICFQTTSGLPGAVSSRIDAFGH